jgi:AcrR family transcriptional regulator
MAKPTPSGETRQELLRAALKRFAHAGYAATSVQQIVADAQVSKPTLYYYFGDKAGLFQALVTEAFEARYRIMREAVGRASGFREQLVEILAGLFDYFRRNRELMRISLATAFAAPGEVPPGLKHLEKALRNFEFIHSLFQGALRRGELNSRFESRELAFGFFGQMNLYLMSHLLMPDQPLDRRTAERIVELFLTGAACADSRKSPTKSLGPQPPE